MYSVHHSKLRTTASGLVSSSQERIVDGLGDDDMGVKSTATTIEERGGEGIKDGTISKTVEFKVHASAA